MTDNNYDPRTVYKEIKIKYFTILAAPLILLLVALYITDSPSTEKLDFAEPLNMALIIFTLATVYLGAFISRKTYQKVSPDSDIKKRLSKFQAGLLIRLATYESVEIFAIVVFIINGNLLVLLFALIGLFGVITNYPGPSRIKQSVGLDEIDLL